MRGLMSASRHPHLASVATALPRSAPRHLLHLGARCERVRRTLRAHRIRTQLRARCNRRLKGSR
eukprot:6908019-Prymnesium_polylepis.1